VLAVPWLWGHRFMLDLMEQASSSNIFMLFIEFGLIELECLFDHY
jgi:hypothetical protein